MAAAGAAGEAAGGILGAVGSLQSGYAQSNALNYQAQSDDENAVYARQAGDYDSALSGLRSSAKIGSMTASYGASGVDIAESSAADIISQSAASAELDRMNILHGADIKALHFSNQARLDRVGANNAESAGQINAVAALISGGGKVAANSSLGSNGKVGSDSTDMISEAAY